MNTVSPVNVRCMNHRVSKRIVLRKMDRLWIFRRQQQQQQRIDRFVVHRQIQFNDLHLPTIFSQRYVRLRWNLLKLQQSSITLTKVKQLFVSPTKIFIRNHRSVFSDIDRWVTVWPITLQMLIQITYVTIKWHFLLTNRSRNWNENIFICLKKSIVCQIFSLSSFLRSFSRIFDGCQNEN